MSRVSRLVVALTLLLGSAQGSAQDLSWQRLGDGLSVSVWKPGARCPQVPPSLVATIDPERYQFSMHHYVHEGLSHPPTIEEWQQRTGHQVLFNAGLFTQGYEYLGLLYKNGRSLGSRRHASWHGLFVAEPIAPTGRRARVLDLTVDGFDEQRVAYREVAQALMLVDSGGGIRVRQTGKQAFQTLVAETREGHIAVFKTLDPVSLYDIGQCLRDTLPFIDRVMAMDGGSSSDLIIPTSLWPQTHASQPAWKSLFAGTTAIHIPLPTVIGISPR